MLPSPMPLPGSCPAVEESQRSYGWWNDYSFEASGRLVSPNSCTQSLSFAPVVYSEKGSPSFSSRQRVSPGFSFLEAGSASPWKCLVTHAGHDVPASSVKWWQVSVAEAQPIPASYHGPLKPQRLTLSTCSSLPRWALPKHQNVLAPWCDCFRERSTQDLGGTPGGLRPVPSHIIPPWIGFPPFPASLSFPAPPHPTMPPGSPPKSTTYTQSLSPFCSKRNPN